MHDIHACMWQFKLAVQFYGPRTVLIKDLHNTMNNIMVDTTKGETLPTIITHAHAQGIRLMTNERKKLKTSHSANSLQ